MKLKTPVSLSLIALAISVSLTVQAQTFSVIHSFSGPEGAEPAAGLTIRGSSLFGTANVGGIENFGTVYELVHTGSAWGTLPIYLFKGGADGANPQTRVVFGPDGHPYGTTYSGGSTGRGVVFDLVPPLTICKTANCFWKENPLYQFQSGTDASQPLFGDLAWDAAGNIYGTTSGGGLIGIGTVYELKPSGNSWTESVIYSFSGDDGDEPQNGVVLDANDNVFGTTLYGGRSNFGNIFELTYTVGAGWTEHNVYEFQGDSDGKLPVAGLIFDSSHTNLYGATSDGGVGGGGTIFELSPSGDSWAYNVLYSFAGNPSLAMCGPWGSLTMDTAGNLYGTTQCDGANGFGSVFKLSKSGNTWAYTSLYDFKGVSDGAYPISNVSIDSNGKLYGTASEAGNSTCLPPIGCGVVWTITP